MKTITLGLAVASLLVGNLASASPNSAQSIESFFKSLTTLCGKTFEGVIVADEPPPAANDPFTGKRLVMHVESCSDAEIRVPFAVGADRSRTWIITRTAEGLRLKHDHRHEDGTPDDITFYGGDTLEPGTPSRQRFPADAETLALFREQGLVASLTNIWSLELVENQFFVYELARPEGRLFRVRFDLGAAKSSDQ